VTENVNRLVLHMIRWRRKQNMWVHPINIKKPKFRIFSHLYLDLLEDEQKFHGFLKNEHCAILPCHRWWENIY
jgi:SPX domain protein involved in polyphosphate accumulation